MKTLFLPLVDWGMGSFLIGVFAVVCIILILVVYSLSRSTERAKDDITEDDNENQPTT